MKNRLMIFLEGISLMLSLPSFAEIGSPNNLSVTVPAVNGAQSETANEVPPTYHTYQVPVKYASFEVEDVELRVRKKNRVTLEYTFPKYLIGEENFQIQAEGSCKDSACAQPIELKSEHGKFTCRIDLAKKTGNCRGDYDRKVLPVLKEGGLAPVQEYLKANIADPNELNLRQGVLLAFSHEAAGVFENLKVRVDRK